LCCRHELELQLLGILLLAGSDSNVMKRHPIELREWPRILVVADDQGDAAVQLANLVPIEQVDETMLIVRDQQRYRDLSLSENDLPVDLQPFRQWGELLPELQFIKIEIAQRPFDTHEEEAQLSILVLVGVKDISTVFEEEIGNGRDQSLAIG
jgi:hypothetical protein